MQGLHNAVKPARCSIGPVLNLDLYATPSERSQFGVELVLPERVVHLERRPFVPRGLSHNT